MREILTKVLNFLGLAYWVEIVTNKPQCTYYFGPFMDRSEAKLAQSGYIEDLNDEGAREIRVTIKRFKPSDLTIYQDLEDRNQYNKIANFTRQVS
ncbi:MAG: DUF1816 domain-containing protein [Prochloraceae cyanobacterium]